jgi:hypothetical protein
MVKAVYLLLILSGLSFATCDRIEAGEAGDSLFTTICSGALGQHGANPQVDSKLAAGSDVKFLGAL